MVTNLEEPSEKKFEPLHLPKNSKNIGEEDRRPLLSSLTSVDSID